MQYRYPYQSQLKADISKLKEGRHYFLWHKAGVKDPISNTDGPIIEIGGPSDLGYFFLDGVDLRSKPIITNISNNPMPYAENPKELADQVQEVVDGRSMPYKDNSVGMFLMSHISASSDWWVELDTAKQEKAAPQFEKEYDLAALETGQVALGVLEPSKVKHAQRVQIFREAYRALRPGGLLVSDGEIEDLVILQRLGFELAAFLQVNAPAQGQSKLLYEFVVKKPISKPDTMH